MSGRGALPGVGPGMSPGPRPRSGARRARGSCRAGRRQSARLISQGRPFSAGWCGRVMPHQPASGDSRSDSMPAAPESSSVAPRDGARRLAEAILAESRRAGLQPGSRLPPERQLAARLGVRCGRRWPSWRQMVPSGGKRAGEPSCGTLERMPRSAMPASRPATARSTATRPARSPATCARSSWPAASCPPVTNASPSSNGGPGRRAARSKTWPNAGSSAATPPGTTCGGSAGNLNGTTSPPSKRR